VRKDRTTGVGARVRAGGTISGTSRQKIYRIRLIDEVSASPARRPRSEGRIYFLSRRDKRIAHVYRRSRGALVVRDCWLVLLSPGLDPSLLHWPVLYCSTRGSAIRKLLSTTWRIPTMVFEGLLVIVGTFVVLAFLFWRAAERPTGAARDASASHSSELHKV